MKALFLGHFAASVAPRILTKVKTPLETSILDDETDVARLAPLLADAEIAVGHIWRAGFPPASKLRLLQSVAAGLDLLDTGAVPKGVTICNVFGHEPAIAEYAIMTMLVLTHRLFEAVTMFREGSWCASPQFGGGAPHGEVLGQTIGIIGYGRIGREVAERAAGLKSRVLAVNRSPVAEPARNADTASNRRWVRTSIVMIAYSAIAGSWPNTLQTVTPFGTAPVSSRSIPAATDCRRRSFGAGGNPARQI
jgi:phosphoglycerate dehydrogenase-like enzyme